MAVVQLPEKKEVTILLAEDDPGHARLIEKNLRRADVANRIVVVADGQAALDYLNRENGFSDPAAAPRPGIILLDLRLPKVDGMEVLKQLKADPKFSSIPVVILSTSQAEQDIVKAYALHANSYLVKPVDFANFTELMETFDFYWLAWNQRLG